MEHLARAALHYCIVLARRGTTMTEYEAQLYEASARFATTVLNFEDACSQSALIKAERELNDLTKGKIG